MTVGAASRQGRDCSRALVFAGDCWGTNDPKIWWLTGHLKSGGLKLQPFVYLTTLQTEFSLGQSSRLGQVWPGLSWVFSWASGQVVGQLGLLVYDSFVWDSWVDGGLSPQGLPPPRLICKMGKGCKSNKQIGTYYFCYINGIDDLGAS